MNARHEDVPLADIPRYTWLLSRYPNFPGFLHSSFPRSRGETLLPTARGAESSIGVRNRKQFPLPVQAVGADGEVVGVEISPDLAAIARKQWNNVRVAVGPAQTIALSGKFDGLLLFAAHEVLTSPEALDHLLAHLKKRKARLWHSAPNSRTRDEADY